MYKSVTAFMEAVINKKLGQTGGERVITIRKKKTND